MKSIFLILPVSILFLLSCQPNQNKNQEQSESVKKESVKVTVKDVEKGIRDNIEEITRNGDGYFNYKKDSFDLSLKLVRVHTEYLSVLGKNRFFACVDLATENGDVYDVDFFLEGTADSMQVTQTDLHKLNGKPFYTWKQAKDKTWYTVPVKQASNDLLGVIEGNDRFAFNYAVKLPEITGTAKIWIPIAQSDQFQEIEIDTVDVPFEYKFITEDDFNNKILVADLGPDNSNQEITISYSVNRNEKEPYQEEKTNLDKHLAATPLLPVGDRFGVIANQVIESKAANTPLTKARALYDHVIEEIRYAKQGVYGTGDANYACDSKSGNCTEFHSYFISLARSADIPARFAVGAAIPSERNEGGVNGYHCWAEFYADGKWWPVDISEANKYSALATYYFGHHPANRIEFSKGRNLQPDPLPKSGAINFLAYPVFEIEGETQMVETAFTFERIGQKIN